MTRICNQCGKELTLNHINFIPKANIKSGYSGKCRGCTNDNRNEIYKNGGSTNKGAYEIKERAYSYWLQHKGRVRSGTVRALTRSKAELNLKEKFPGATNIDIEKSSRVVDNQDFLIRCKF